MTKPHTTEIVRMYRNGSEINEIADTVGATLSTVKNCLSRYHIPRRERPVRARCTRTLDVLARYETGERVKDIAARHGITSAAVSKTLARHNVPKRGRLRTRLEKLTHNQLLEFIMMTQSKQVRHDDAYNYVLKHC